MYIEYNEKYVHRPRHRSASSSVALHTLVYWGRPWVQTDGDEKGSATIIDLGAKADVKAGLYKEGLDKLQAVGM